MPPGMPHPSRRLIKTAGYRWSGITPIRMIIINLKRERKGERERETERLRERERKRNTE